jgi:acetolactate synthase I/II/III large subunit
MAVAEAKLTGRVGVFAVSRGPGATNGSIAVHVAQQDAVPVVVLIGQVSREERGRGAFQEVDYTEFSAP